MMFSGFSVQSFLRAAFSTVACPKNAYVTDSNTVPSETAVYGKFKLVH